MLNLNPKYEDFVDLIISYLTELSKKVLMEHEDIVDEVSHSEKHYEFDLPE
jgi:hypothetical protein